ncbi:MAG: methyltransferase [Bacteroidales bacterium]|nr:methyltransferase [Bacteroidales bacterium]
MDTRPFHFKSFSLHHHRSTMKVGTDAVLLGIWTDLTNVRSALDVGTGCGIISLLLASRAQVSVDAIELDKDSFEEAKQNFGESPYSDCFRIFNSDFNDFVPPKNKKYDLIISNPPFFVNDLRSTDPKKRMARHTQTLTYDRLLKVSMELLNPNGKISVVLPYRESRLFLQQAILAGFFVEKKMLIFPMLGKEPNRINILIGHKSVEEQTEKFMIRDEYGEFTNQYVDFVKDYYVSV